MQRWIVSAPIVAILLVGSLLGQAAQAQKSLYDRLGGQPAVDAVANNLVDRILADKRVNTWFKNAAASPQNTAAYKAKLSSFICSAVGGPCKYTGRDMVAAHKGRAVTNEAFNAVAEDLSAVLDQLKVPAPEKREVMELIGSLRTSIVQAPAAN
jgi:hemoglobin